MEPQNDWLWPIFHANPCLRLHYFLSSPADVFDDLTFFKYDVAPALSDPRSGLPVITFANDVTPAQAIEVDESNQELPKVGADYKRARGT
ncbi:hypothetical protein M0R45_020946 [Rubus argutus]|uniref:Uncharacterized protein n=1 Tax=Rubus argutus TaxID=59490 RepID=A0AAW1XAB0_RUBAR